MVTRRSRRAGLVVLLVLAAGSSTAQEADFLFSAPRGSFSLRGGWLFASTASDIYSFFGDLFTVESSDFDAPLFGADVALVIHPRLDAMVGFDFNRSKIASAYRDLVEDNDLPITQQTELTTVPIMGSLKLYLAPRGREISRYAFVPAAVRPYVGGGGGFLWYKLEQFGDFVDFTDLAIFTTRLGSDGFGLEAHLFGGAEVRLTPRIYLTIEGRYLWSDAQLDADFIGFEPIDLSGLRTSVGISFNF
ncbi:MAG TPA: hypothetical protein VLK65_16945 [Vicinamibacteria bacterium]|nr:hypothetical protein [Vicinamibacteria bacterium]